VPYTGYYTSTRRYTQYYTDLKRKIRVYAKPNGGCASQRAVASPAGVVRLPLLPSSLRHLHLWADKFNYIYDFDYVLGQPFVDYCDWHCLDPCTNLERLTLPTCYSLKGQLKAFVQSARHLPVICILSSMWTTETILTKLEDRCFRNVS